MSRSVGDLTHKSLFGGVRGRRRRHEDLDAHYPFTDAQYARVLDLATQAGTPGFIAKLIENALAQRSAADMDEYIEAHAPIAAEVEQQWKDVAGVRSGWWRYKYPGSDEVVTSKDPILKRGVDGVAERIAQQQQAHEADFPGAGAKREEIQRLAKEAEKRVEELVKAWGRETHATASTVAAAAGHASGAHAAAAAGHASAVRVRTGLPKDR